MSSSCETGISSNNIFKDGLSPRFDWGIGFRAGVEIARHTQIAIGYDWLYDWLSQESREIICAAIIDKGLEGNPVLLTVLIVAELGLVIGISWGINKMAAATATALFALYAALNGVTLGYIFVVYTLPAITGAFLTTAATFAVMAIIGTVTRRDLSKLGSILFMALIGLILASLVNLFLQNSMFGWIVTYAGVLIFVGLTAYDAQKIKRLYLQMGGEMEINRKLSVLGALTLYLDFINLFLMLLRIFGGRRN